MSKNISLPNKTTKKRSVGRSHLQIGKLGEDAAVQLLLRENFIILDRNWKCEAGELDIIALRETILSIVEVKTRSIETADNFSPFAAVDYRKAKKIKKITNRYLFLERDTLEQHSIQSISLDVIGAFYAIDSQTKRLKMRLFYMPDAFNY